MNEIRPPVDLTVTITLTEEERHHALGIMLGREPRPDACPKCQSITAKLRRVAMEEVSPRVEVNADQREPEFRDFGVEQPLTSEMASLNNEAIGIIRIFVDAKKLSPHEREALRAMLRDSLDEVVYGGPTAGGPEKDDEHL